MIVIKENKVIDYVVDIKHDDIRLTVKTCTKNTRTKHEEFDNMNLDRICKELYTKEAFYPSLETILKEMKHLFGYIDFNNTITKSPIEVSLVINYSEKIFLDSAKFLSALSLKPTTKQNMKFIMVQKYKTT